MSQSQDPSQKPGASDERARSSEGCGASAEGDFQRLGQGLLPSFEGLVFQRSLPEILARTDDASSVAEILNSEQLANDKYRKEVAEQDDASQQALHELAAWVAVRGLNPHADLSKDLFPFLAPRISLASDELASHLEQLSVSRKSLSERSDTNESDDELAKKTDSAKRLSYTVRIEDQRSELLENLSELQVWNRPFNGGEELLRHHPPVNARLEWSSLADVRRACDEVLRDQELGVTLILPFAKEPDTAHLNSRYALELLEAEAFIPVSANYDRRSELMVERVLAAEEAGELMSQRAVLSAVDWGLVCERCAIPMQRSGDGSSVLPVKGTKGLTMLAGMLVAAARERLLGSMVGFHDSDIANPWSYDALRYLAMPLALSPEGERPFSVALGKTGPGRNNQGWTSQMNRDASKEAYEPFVRKIARVAGTLIWPLSGERFISGDILYRTPWTNGMSIETQLNLAVATEVVRQSVPGMAQVLNPVKKIENGIVDEVREWDMIQMCAGWAADVMRFCNRERSYLTDFGVTEVRKFNMEFGGIAVDSFHQSENDAPNKVTTSTTNYMLPSLKQLAEMSAIDWDYLRELVGR